MTQKKGPLTGTQRALTLAARGDCYNPDCPEPLITCRNGIHLANFEFAHIKDECPPTNDQSDIVESYFSNIAFSWSSLVSTELVNSFRIRFSSWSGIVCPILLNSAPRSPSFSFFHSRKISIEKSFGRTLSINL